MSSTEDIAPQCTIIVEELFAKINAQRKLIKKFPIEDRALISRCSLRFNLNRQSLVDFNAESITLAPKDMVALEKVVNEQFGLFFAGELNSLCVKRSKKPAADSDVSPDPSAQQKAHAVAARKNKNKGLFARILRLFGRK